MDFFLAAFTFLLFLGVHDGTEWISYVKSQEIKKKVVTRDPRFSQHCFA